MFSKTNEKLDESYSNEVNKKLNAFSNANEWSDFIFLLNSLEDTLKKYKAHKSIVCLPNLIKRLNQCLNPVLPTGIHLKTLEVYDTIFKIINSDFTKTIEYKQLILGLLNFSLHCKIVVTKKYLDLIETHVIKNDIKNIVEDVLVSLLPMMESESGDFYLRAKDLIRVVKEKCDPHIFKYNLFNVFSKYETLRVSIVNYLKDSEKEILKNSEKTNKVKLEPFVLKAFIVAINSDNIFVIRYFLDNINNIELNSILIKNLIKLFLMKEFSINKRINKILNRKGLILGLKSFINLSNINVLFKLLNILDDKYYIKKISYDLIAFNYKNKLKVVHGFIDKNINDVKDGFLLKTIKKFDCLCLCHKNKDILHALESFDKKIEKCSACRKIVINKNLCAKTKKQKEKAKKVNYSVFLSLLIYFFKKHPGSLESLNQILDFLTFSIVSKKNLIKIEILIRYMKIYYRQSHRKETIFSSLLTNEVFSLKNYKEISSRKKTLQGKLESKKGIIIGKQENEDFLDVSEESNLDEDSIYKNKVYNPSLSRLISMTSLLKADKVFHFSEKDLKFISGFIMNSKAVMKRDFASELKKYLIKNIEYEFLIKNLIESDKAFKNEIYKEILRKFKENKNPNFFVFYDLEDFLIENIKTLKLKEIFILLKYCINNNKYIKIMFLLGSILDRNNSYYTGLIQNIEDPLNVFKYIIKTYTTEIIAEKKESTENEYKNFLFINPVQKFLLTKAFGRKDKYFLLINTLNFMLDLLSNINSLKIFKSNTNMEDKGFEEMGIKESVVNMLLIMLNNINPGEKTGEDPKRQAEPSTPSKGPQKLFRFEGSEITALNLLIFKIFYILNRNGIPVVLSEKKFIKKILLNYINNPNILKYSLFLIYDDYEFIFNNYLNYYKIVFFELFHLDENKFYEYLIIKLLNNENCSFTLKLYRESYKYLKYINSYNFQPYYKNILKIIIQSLNKELIIVFDRRSIKIEKNSFQMENKDSEDYDTEEEEEDAQEDPFLMKLNKKVKFIFPSYRKNVLSLINALFKDNDSLFIEILPNDLSVLPIIAYIPSKNQNLKVKIYKKLIPKLSSFTLMHFFLSLNSECYEAFKLKYSYNKLSENDLLFILKNLIDRFDKTIFNNVLSNIENDVYNISVIKLLYCVILKNTSFLNNFKNIIFTKINKDFSLIFILNDIFKNSRAVFKSDDFIEIFVDQIYTLFLNNGYKDEKKKIAESFVNPFIKHFYEDSFFKFGCKVKMKIFRKISFNKNVLFSNIFQGLDISFFSNNINTKVFSLKKIAFLILSFKKNCFSSFCDKLIQSIFNLLNYNKNIKIEIYRLIRVLLFKFDHSYIKDLYPFILEDILKNINCNDILLKFSVFSVIDISMFLSSTVFKFNLVLYNDELIANNKYFDHYDIFKNKQRKTTKNLNLIETLKINQYNDFPLGNFMLFNTNIKTLDDLDKYVAYSRIYYDLMDYYQLDKDLKNCEDQLLESFKLP